MSTAAEEPPILYERSGPVATITLNRPEKLNAVTLPMQLGYIDALDRADADPEVRAVVVTGAGRGFCSGADLEVLEQGPPALRALVPNTAVMPVHALRIRKPVLAAVNGAVAGIGFAMMACTDVRFVSSTARMSTSFARLGLVAEYGLSWLLPRQIGLGPAIDLLYSGRAIDAAEASAMGLVQRVCEPDELMAAAYDAAGQYAECSPRSLAVMKEQIYTDLQRPLSDALDAALDRMYEAFEGEDLAEAVAARAARRQAVFRPLR
jgi:enoyl-CoA hydratase/carnithine racemase